MNLRDTIKKRLAEYIYPFTAGVYDKHFEPFYSDMMSQHENDKSQYVFVCMPGDSNRPNNIYLVDCAYGTRCDGWSVYVDTLKTNLCLLNIENYTRSTFDNNNNTVIIEKRGIDYSLIINGDTILKSTAFCFVFTELINRKINLDDFDCIDIINVSSNKLWPGYIVSVVHDVLDFGKDVYYRFIDRTSDTDANTVIVESKKGEDGGEIVLQFDFEPYCGVVLSLTVYSNECGEVYHDTFFDNTLSSALIRMAKFFDNESIKVRTNA